MNYVIIENIKLAYLDKNQTEEKTIVFLHGNSHSKRSFLAQINNPALSDFRLIAIDLPGHGESDKLVKYSLDIISNLLHKFLKRLNVTEFVLVGSSLGGHLAIQLSKRIDPLGIIIFGTPPLSKPFTGAGFLTNENALPLSTEVASLESLRNLADELRYDQKYRLQFIEDYIVTDPKFRSQIFESVFLGEYSDELVILNNFKFKALALLPKYDSIIDSVYVQKTINHSGFDAVEISTGHSVHIENPDFFILAVKDFIFDCFKCSSQYPLNSIYIEGSTYL